MCLNTVTKKLKKNDLMKVGYKVLHKKHIMCNDGWYRTWYSSVFCDSMKIRKMGISYNADRREDSSNFKQIYSKDHKFYDVGFHIWEHLNDAIRDRDGSLNKYIIKVIAWDIRAYGFNQYSSFGNRDIIARCFVAKHTRLMEVLTIPAKIHCPGGPLSGW